MLLVEHPPTLGPSDRLIIAEHHFESEQSVENQNNVNNG